MTSEIRNIGDKVKLVRAAANTALTAGGGGDNTAVTGLIIDRAAYGWPESMVVGISFAATLGASETLQFATTVQEGDASNLSDAATLLTQAATTVATGAGTITGCHEIDVSLRGAGRYVRVNHTPNLSASGTDTATTAAFVVLGGMERLPQ